MFNVVVDRRKRRAWSARTVAVSVGAHLLVLAGVVTAAANTPSREIVEPDPWVFPLPEKAPPPRPVKPPPPAARVDQPPPVKGRTLALPTPTTVPEDLPPAEPDEPPTDPKDYSGQGPVGNMIGTPPATPPQPPADPELPASGGEQPLPPSAVDQLPQLASPRDAQRMLERMYPPMLRDAGVTGHTTVVLVIDETGAVQPGSVSVQESTHDAFRDAAIRAAERFRFRPARLRGQPISVVISIPIEWTIRS